MPGGGSQAISRARIHHPLLAHRPSSPILSTAPVVRTRCWLTDRRLTLRSVLGRAREPPVRTSALGPSAYGIRTSLAVSTCPGPFAGRRMHRVLSTARLESRSPAPASHEQGGGLLTASVGLRPHSINAHSFDRRHNGRRSILAATKLKERNWSRFQCCPFQYSQR